MSNEILVKEQQHIQYIDQNSTMIANQNKLQGDDLKNFLIQCKRTGLDPITRQIYAIPNNGKLTIMASIDGLRLIAERSGAYEGQTAPQWCGEDGVWKDVWLSKTPPKACKIGVFKTKFREALIAIALFDEYAGKQQRDDQYGKYKKGDLTFMWAKMPALMIAKVAEALALRKAFPNEMSGIYSTEEMEQSGIETKEREAKPNNVGAAVKGQKTEEKHTISDAGEYVVQFGKKFSGKKIKDILPHEHESMLRWLEGEIKKGKSLSPSALEYSHYAEAFLAPDREREPMFNEAEEMPGQFMKQLDDRFPGNDNDIDGLLVGRKKMTFEECFEGFNFEKQCDEMIQEMAIEGGYCGKAFEEFAQDIIIEANRKGVIVSDEKTFCVDSFFYNIYQCTEKGLS